MYLNVYPHGLKFKFQYSIKDDNLSQWRLVQSRLMEIFKNTAYDVKYS